MPKNTAFEAPALRITCPRGGEHILPLIEAPAFISASLEDAVEILMLDESKRGTSSFPAVAVARSRIQEALDAFLQFHAATTARQEQEQKDLPE